MRYLFLLLPCFFLLTACTDDDQLPLPNTCLPEPPVDYDGPFRCLVNGQEWRPERPDIWTPYQFQYYDDVKAISISAMRKLADESVNQSIDFSALPITLGENKIRYRQNSFLDWNNEGNCIGYDLDTLKPRVIFIETLDRTNRQIKGTFYFSVYDPECDESIDITDGEFEFGY